LIRCINKNTGVIALEKRIFDCVIALEKRIFDCVIALEKRILNCGIALEKRKVYIFAVLKFKPGKRYGLL